jgi:hypothetical protein
MLKIFPQDIKKIFRSSERVLPKIPAFLPQLAKRISAETDT